MSRALLQNVYLFKKLANPELDAIGEIGKVQIYALGDTIFRKGDKATGLYLIKHGSVRIQETTKSGDAVDVALLSTGSHFGEMAFVDGEPRSATAVAAERSELIVISYEKLDLYLKQNADVAVGLFRELAHFLCGRLRVTTSDLSYAKEKNLSHF